MYEKEVKWLILTNYKTDQNVELEVSEILISLTGDVTRIKLFNCSTHYFIYEMARVAVLMLWVAMRTRWIQPYRSFRQCLTHSDHSVTALTADVVVIVVTVWIGDNDANNIDLWKLNKIKCLTCSRNSVWVHFPQMTGTLSAYAVWTPEDRWHSASRSYMWLWTENYCMKRQNLKSK